MNPTVLPAGYRSKLSVYETQRAIEFIKQSFQKNLCAALNLKRVSAPLFVRSDTGLNDDLNGVERAGLLRCAGRRAAASSRWCIRWPSGSAGRSSSMTSMRARACTPI